MAIIKDPLDGRWKTIDAPEDPLKEVLSAIKEMSPEEKRALKIALEQAAKSNPRPLETLRLLEYDEEPCPPDRFLEDPFYMGEVGKGTYPWIKSVLPRIFKGGYDEIVATGAQRIGKDWMATCCIAYLLHILLCLKDPAQSYGLAKGSNIYIVFMSATQELSRDALFTGFSEKLKQSPWFQKFGKSMKVLAEEIKFPKGILLKGAESSDLGVVGLNVCAVVVDECNISRRTKALHEKPQALDRTEAIYQAIRRRIRMTFNLKNGPPTLLMSLGSRRFPSDFIDRRINELKNSKKALVVDLPLWEAKGRENFSEKSFKVLVGNDATPSRILGEGEKPPAGARIIEVPEDFRSDFEGDTDGSLRDIGGISVRTILPYFANQAAVQAMIDDGRIHPVKTLEWRVNEAIQIEWDRLVRTEGGKLIPLMSPNTPRCVAIDLGRTRNPTGFSFGYVKGYKTVNRKAPDGRIYQENLPYIVVEFVLRISPVHGTEIKFYQVRELLFRFIEHGIPIRMAVLDHWQSDDSVQLLQDQGIDCEKIKTDYKSYDVFKQAVYEERVKVYAYKPLFDDLSLLEEDPKRRKIDIFSEDTGNLHHDVADSVCLLVNRLSKDFKASDFAPVSPEFNFSRSRNIEMEYTVVPQEATPFSLFPGESLPPLPDTAPTADFSAHGIVFDDNEIGWGGETGKKQETGFIAFSKTPIVRVEVIAQEFCSRIKIESVQSVTADQIKLFLFEKGLTDPKLVTAMKTHIERVFGKPVK